jgi:methyl acetate hydrolase
MSQLENILDKYTNNKSLPVAFGAIATRDKGIVYVGSSGFRNIEDASTKVDNESILAFFSCTKAVTTTALLQLLEKGLIKSIDDPVENYVPDIKDIKVLKGFDEFGSPILVDPKTKTTIRHLITHTSGLSYSFFSYAYRELYEKHNTADILKSTWDQFQTPYIFEPGTKWHYGAGVDWAGKIVYEVSKQSLGDYCKKNIFEKIDAKSLTFERSDSQIKNTIQLHQRTEDGSVHSLGEILTEKPEFHPGGHGLYGTISDYVKFLEIFLHEGKSPITGAQILKPETLKNYSFKNLLPEGVQIESTLEHSQPHLSNKIELFDSIPKESQSWTASFHKIDIELPTGRGSESYGWGGLPNLYYWIDLKKGVTGMFATQLFPFSDPIALEAFQEFETAAYKSFI